MDPAALLDRPTHHQHNNETGIENDTAGIEMEVNLERTTKSSPGQIRQQKAMFDTPFTNINDQGVLGVFGENVSKKIVETLRQINKNADVA